MTCFVFSALIKSIKERKKKQREHLGLIHIKQRAFTSIMCLFSTVNFWVVLDRNVEK